MTDPEHDGHDDHEDAVARAHEEALVAHELEAEFEDVGAAELEPPTWIIENVLPTGITFLAGPPKSMKTTIELGLICAVAGVESNALPPDMTITPEPGRVMGFCAEHTGGELKYMIQSGLGAVMPDDGRFYVAREPFQWRLDDKHAAQRLINQLEKFQPKLFFIDPLRDFHDYDETEAGPMNRLLRPLQRWAKKNKCAFLVLHHTRKPDGKDADKLMTAADMRGSSALFGLADGVIVVTRLRDGQIHFDVVHKRGVAWDRTVRLGLWGETPKETLVTKAREVMEAIWNSPKEPLTLETLTELTKSSKTTVQAARGQLRRLGALDAAFLPTEASRDIVESAARKWSPTK